MTTVNIHEAKTRFSQLVARVADGETITIAKAGTPVARLVNIDAPSAPRRLGFLGGGVSIPDDFDRIGADTIAADFEGAADSAPDEHTQ